MWGSLAIGGAMLGRGVFRVGRSIMGGVGKKAVTETVATAAADAAAASAAKGVAKTAGKKIAETTAKGVAEGAAASAAAGGGVAKGVAAKVASTLTTGLTASSALLAIPVAMSAGLIVAIKKIAADTDAAYAEAQKNIDRNELLRRWTQQQHYGFDWGVYKDESGQLQQGKALEGWDRAAKDVKKTQTIIVDGKPRSGMIIAEHNRYGYRVGAPYSGEHAREGSFQPPRVDINVTLQNQSSQPLKTTDAKSYAPSNY